MAAMSAQELTAYLKNLTELESVRFRQTLLRDKAQEHLRYEQPKKHSIEKPHRKEIPKPKKPEEEVDAVGPAVIGFFFLAITSICFIAMFNERQGYWIFGVLLSCPIACFFLDIWENAAKHNKRAKKEAEEYPKLMKDYDQKIQQAKEKYAQAYADYEMMVQAEENRYALAVTAAQNNYRCAEEQVRQMDGPLEETERVLQQLYDLDIVFPKYRNLPAICMFYEYFSSGRCTELSGPNGAYNLYEAELRQNLIVNKLDAILRGLDGIRQNQFFLYNEVKRAADALPQIANDVDLMLDSANDLSHSAAIALQCAEATKANTEAMKYLAFIKR